MSRLRSSGRPFVATFMLGIVLLQPGLILPATPALALPNPAVDGVWSELTLSAYPPTRTGYSLLYDSNRHRALLFGGSNVGQDFGDVWALDLANPVAWQLVPAIGAISVPRGEMATVYDPVRDRIWVWGGRNASGAVFGEGAYLQFGPAPGDSAVWNTFNADQEPGTGNRPTPRAGQGAVYDPIGRRMIFYGGSYGNLYGTGGTWWLSLNDPPTWHLFTAPSPFSDGATYTSISLVAGGTRLLLAGALGITGYWQFPAYWTGVAWTLALDGTQTWQSFATTNDALFGHEFTPKRSTYHPPQNRLIGYRRGYTHDWGNTGYAVSDIGLLECPLATGVWRRLEPLNGPGPADDFNLLYDPVADRMLAVRDVQTSLPSLSTWFLSFGGTSSVPTPEAPAARWAGPASPNPSNAFVDVAFELSAATRVSASILDAGGRLVRRLSESDYPSGAHQLAWDGRDDAGRVVPAGIYFARLVRSSPAATTVVRIVRTR